MGRRAKVVNCSVARRPDGPPRPNCEPPAVQSGAFGALTELVRAIDDDLSTSTARAYAHDWTDFEASLCPARARSDAGRLPPAARRRVCGDAPTMLRDPCIRERA